LARQGHITGIRRSLDFKEADIGLGHYIWWPAFDANLHRGHLSKMTIEEAWEKLANFWVNILQNLPEAVVVCEYKSSVPSALDWIPTMKAAIAFCKLVNEKLGRCGMAINLEWAHALIGGQTVAEATRMQIDAELFHNFVHANSAELAIIEWNETGTQIVRSPPGDDADWAVGEGSEGRWEDQAATVKR